jgi:hypothetical protein
VTEKRNGPGRNPGHKELLILKFLNKFSKAKGEIERLEILRKECRDRFRRTRIEAWIEAEKKKLLSGENSQQPTAQS